MSLLINGLFAQSLRYAQKIIHLRRINPQTIKYMPACPDRFTIGAVIFSHALILNENPY